MKSKFLLFAAALAIIAVFAVEFVAIKGDGPATKCALTPMTGTHGGYSARCSRVEP
ncbi:MAG: hypothetical protein ACM3SO_22805 [Betaproteobacteria bacterium]